MGHGILPQSIHTPQRHRETDIASWGFYGLVDRTCRTGILPGSVLGCRKTDHAGLRGATMIGNVHKLNRSQTFNRIAVIGCGGTGSAVLGGLPLLDQALRATGQPGLHVIVADGDRVSATNCVRQPFSQSEIGLHKSVVLVNRLNLFWGLHWQASTEDVTIKTDGKVDIIISCVDTRAARRELAESPLYKNCCYYLDIGNNASAGQFMLGQPTNDRNRKTQHRLPTVSDLFPEILVPLLDSTDELPSCSAVDSLRLQEPFINQTLAFHALALLGRLFRQKE